MKLLVTGVNHRTAPVEIREKLAFSEASLGGALDHLRSQPGFIEGMILSTCNRVEIAITAEEATDCQSSMEKFFAESQHVSRDWIAPYLYHHSCSDAIRHLFRVSSSLDSMVRGEPQILAQLKAA